MGNFDHYAYGNFDHYAYGNMVRGALSDTHVFLLNDYFIELNDYFIELNTPSFKNLNEFLN